MLWRSELQERGETIEECYEFMLAYAAQGIPSDKGSLAGSQLREFLSRAAHALEIGTSGTWRNHRGMLRVHAGLRRAGDSERQGKSGRKPVARIPEPRRSCFGDRNFRNVAKPSRNATSSCWPTPRRGFRATREVWPEASCANS